MCIHFLVTENKKTMSTDTMESNTEKHLETSEVNPSCCSTQCDQVCDSQSGNNCDSTDCEKGEWAEACQSSVDGVCCQSDVKDDSDSESDVSNAEQTSAPQDTPVSFDNVDPTHMEFSLMFKCARSTAGQVVQGLQHLVWHLNGSNQYTDDKKVPTNEYQNVLYPKMASLAEKVVSKYLETFVEGVSDPLQKQVFGANLNGNRNNGQLNKFIPCRGVNRFLRYKFAQFGQLLSLLHYRLMFIANRDPKFIKRYVDNPSELLHFEELKQLCVNFCDYLRKDDDSVTNDWATCVTEARLQTNSQGSTDIPPSVKLNAHNVTRTHYQSRQPEQHSQRVSVRRPPRDQGDQATVPSVDGINTEGQFRQPYRQRSEQPFRGRGRGSFGGRGRGSRGGMRGGVHAYGETHDSYRSREDNTTAQESTSQGNTYQGNTYQGSAYQGRTYQSTARSSGYGETRNSYPSREQNTRNSYPSREQNTSFREGTTRQGSTAHPSAPRSSYKKQYDNSENYDQQYPPTSRGSYGGPKRY